MKQLKLSPYNSRLNTCTRRRLSMQKLSSPPLKPVIRLKKRLPTLHHIKSAQIGQLLSPDNDLETILCSPTNLLMNNPSYSSLSHQPTPLKVRNRVLKCAFKTKLGKGQAPRDCAIIRPYLQQVHSQYLFGLVDTELDNKREVFKKTITEEIERFLNQGKALDCSLKLAFKTSMGIAQFQKSEAEFALVLVRNSSFACLKTGSMGWVFAKQVNNEWALEQTGISKKVQIHSLPAEASFLLLASKNLWKTLSVAQATQSLSNSFKKSSPVAALKTLIHSTSSIPVSTLLKMDDFRHACRTGDLPRLQVLTSIHPDLLNTADPSLGWTPLYQTVVSDRFEATEYLLSQGADPNLRTKLGETPLHYACTNNDIDSATLLLSYGSDPNTPQNDGDTPLHYACTQGNSSLVKLLLGYGADLTLKNTVFQKTPRDLAESRGHVSLAAILNPPKALNLVTLATEEGTTDPLYEWLCGHKLAETYAILYEHGFEDLHTLATAVKDGVLNLNVLAKLGLKPAHRRLLLAVFEERGQPSKSEWGLVIRPSLASWLASMHLVELLTNFNDAGFEELEQVVTVMQSRFALNERALKKELNIEKLGYRHRLLVKLAQLSEGCQTGCGTHSVCSSCKLF